MRIASWSCESSSLLPSHLIPSLTVSPYGGCGLGRSWKEIERGKKKRGGDERKKNEMETNNGNE